MNTNSTGNLSAKSNLYYYHDQHLLHNELQQQQQPRPPSLSPTEHEQYTTTYSALHQKHNKSSNSYQHNTFHTPANGSSHHTMTSNTLSTLNPSEFDTKSTKSFNNKNLSKSTKTLNKNKFYGDDDYKIGDNIDNSDSLTSHYYHYQKNGGGERKGKKSKR